MTIARDVGCARKNVPAAPSIWLRKSDRNRIFVHTPEFGSWNRYEESFDSNTHGTKDVSHPGDDV